MTFNETLLLGLILFVGASIIGALIWIVSKDDLNGKSYLTYNELLEEYHLVVDELKKTWARQNEIRKLRKDLDAKKEEKDALVKQLFEVQNWIQNRTIDKLQSENDWLKVACEALKQENNNKEAS